MKQLTLLISGLYGMSAIILGALGSHAFKQILSVDKLASFEIGVRYQMYHAIVLLILGLCLKFRSPLENFSSIFLMLGTFLFSFSIYILSFSEHLGINLSTLGSVTPFGGILMILGWLLLVIYFVRYRV